MTESAITDLDDFTRIAIRHGTDKFGGHLYTPVYDRLFAPLRRKRLRILEIGIGGYDGPLEGGLGLATLAEYFPVSRIVGLDIAQKRLRPHPRITTVQGSQTDTAVLDRLWREHGPFDIVIDDGSHLPEHVLITFRHLYPKMRPDGLYVVEDTQVSVFKDFGSPSGTNTIFELAARVSLAMHADEVAAGGADPLHTEFGHITQSVTVHRNLIVFARGDNAYPSNHRFDPEHEAVAAVRRAIESEGEINASPGFYLTLIDMESWAKRDARALALAREAMERYPASREVLAYVHRVFERHGLRAECARAAALLAALLPDDRDVQALARAYAQEQQAR